MSEYIKREDAISQFEEICDYNKCTCIRGGEWCDICSIGLLISELRNKPAEDVAPVVHGRLLNPNPYGECSLCGCLIDIRDGYNYCPNCGAKMDAR